MNKTSRILIAALSVLAAVTATADDVLPKSRSEALAMEAKDALPLTNFYDPPNPLGARTPGALIRSESFQGYSLPPGAHAVRILYVSRSLDGAPVAASGVVLIPAGPPPRRGPRRPAPWRLAIPNAMWCAAWACLTASIFPTMRVATGWR